MSNPVRKVVVVSEALQASELRLCQYVPNLVIGENSANNEFELAQVAVQCGKHQFID